MFIILNYILPVHGYKKEINDYGFKSYIENWRIIDTKRTFTILNYIDMNILGSELIPLRI